MLVQLLIEYDNVNGGLKEINAKLWARMKIYSGALLYNQSTQLLAVQGEPEPEKVWLIDMKPVFLGEESPSLKKRQIMPKIVLNTSMPSQIFLYYKKYLVVVGKQEVQIWQPQSGE